MSAQAVLDWALQKPKKSLPSSKTNKCEPYKAGSTRSAGLTLRYVVMPISRNMKFRTASSKPLGKAPNSP
jgi:hypothetical protein